MSRLDMSVARRDALRRRTAEMGQVRIETDSCRKVGTTVDVEAINVPLRDDRGQITGYLGIHRDVTERRRAEAHRAYHAPLLENLNDALLATDEWYLAHGTEPAACTKMAMHLQQRGRSISHRGNGEISGNAFLRDFQGAHHRRPIGRTPRQ
jgi:hypothetical protein